MNKPITDVTRRKWVPTGVRGALLAADLAVETAARRVGWTGDLRTYLVELDAAVNSEGAGRVTASQHRRDRVVTRSLQLQFADLVQAELERRGWSHKDLALRADIHQTHVSGFLRGDRPISFALLEKVGIILGLRWTVTAERG